ncbi:hypothetical protein Kpol_1044p18 [Vanderwaltozyma polyspora DSM 70294]|uniref:GPI ethanolamine phosphate transferase 3 n=1 Tax=Vanderwaltozyma polyspora (strain ATCC 22028 / DSM 70294 / BCRC 21397 / CBS 2163 / NBRC 10782 / NRRL Y-8283 / UCD 57-17) TaxID=436907 RepID=A7TP49_VANPO|nr:uncharacterized protein Kpol_1044p18 [Vanderwaltozyma polyspora DSM 70294]EDO15959.1 hypothetical protein Kpol_1044p18 [Vanderwaltozyma polyspora DSM 70294]
MDEETLKRSILSYSVEDRRIYRASITKFRKSHSLYVALLGSLALLQFISIAFFTKGLLFTNHYLDTSYKTNSRNNVDNIPDIDPQFSKAIVLVLDSLSLDSIAFSELSANDNFNHQLSSLTSPDDEISSQKLFSYVSKEYTFEAESSTHHTSKLQDLFSGTVTDLAKCVKNFTNCLLFEDNFLHKLNLNYKNVYFANEHYWDSIDGIFSSNQRLPATLANNAEIDTYTIDPNKDTINFLYETVIDKSNDIEKWEVLIGHLYGLKPHDENLETNDPSILRNQIEIDKLITDLKKSMDNDTLLMVVSGNSKFSTKDVIKNNKNILYLYSNVPNLWNYSVADNSNLIIGKDNSTLKYSNIDKVDIIPSISLLLDLPLPVDSLGLFIPELANSEEHFNTYLNVNKLQIQYLLKNKKVITNDSTEYILYPVLPENSDYLSWKKFQQKILTSYKGFKTVFDYWYLSIGVSFLIISLILLFSMTKLIPSIIVNQMVHQFATYILASSILFNIYLNLLYYLFKRPGFIDNQVWCILFATSIGIIVGCILPILIKYNLKWIVTRFFNEFSDYWSLIGVLFVIIHSLLITSNSLTIWEDKIVSYLLITFGILALYEFVFIPKRQTTSAVVTAVLSEQHGTSSGVSSSIANSYALPLSRFARILGGYHSFILIFCTRLASTITTCREGQEKYCIPTFSTDINHSWWCMGFFVVALMIIPVCIKGYYNLSSSYQAAAPIWIDYLLRGFLIFDFIFWCLKKIETNTPNLSIDISIINFTIIRIATMYAMVACNIAWIWGPLCVKLNVKNADMRSQQSTILGYSNIYGAPFFLLIINAIISILIFNKPLAQISLALMCNQLLSLMEIIELLKLKENIIGSVMLGILSYQQFFSTGHQFTISSIQWDMGFLLSDNLEFPITHLSVIINTFGPYILVSFAVALLTLWRQPPDILKPQTLLGRIVSNCGSLITYHTIICLSSFIWVTHFRRHDMLWEIFLPRFLYSCMSLMITQFVVTLGTIAFASGRLIRHINDIFWK